MNFMQYSNAIYVISFVFQQQSYWKSLFFC